MTTFARSNRNSHTGISRADAQGFTLVELVIVVLILGILGTVAVGRATYSYKDSIQVTLQTNLDAIYDAIDLNRHGAYPATIDAHWFRSGKLPHHPQAAGGVSTIQVATDPTTFDPTNKVITNANAPYWYNSGNGEVRVRVGVVGTEAETLAFYNAINGTTATSLGNYAAGSKGTPSGGGGEAGK